MGESGLTRESGLTLFAKNHFFFVCDSHTKNQQLIAIPVEKMARLNAIPKNTLLRDLPDKDKMQLALQWLQENPTESPTSAARIHCIANVQSVQQAWRREKKRQQRAVELQHGGQNKILDTAQHQALVQYAIDQATDGGMGATKQMMYSAAVYLRRQQGKEPPSKRWFQGWLNNAMDLHTIKTKPISRHRVNMHTEKDLREWFEKGVSACT